MKIGPGILHMEGVTDCQSDFSNTLSVSENGPAKLRTQRVDFTSLSLCRSADRESVLFGRMALWHHITHILSKPLAQRFLLLEHRRL
jgi:hypothetical protein